MISPRELGKVSRFGMLYFRQDYLQLTSDTKQSFLVSYVLAVVVSAQRVEIVLE